MLRVIWRNTRVCERYNLTKETYILTLVASPAEEETTRQFKWIQLKYWAASLII